MAAEGQGVLDYRSVWHSEDQRDIFSLSSRYTVLAAGRRWGKTDGAAEKLIEICLGVPGSKHLWVDTKQANIDKYMERYFLPKLNRLPKQIWKYRKQQKILTFPPLGSVVDFGSAEIPQNLEGFGYTHLWANEAGIIFQGKSGEQLWHNTLKPMLMEGVGAKVAMFGTPKGPGLFREMFERGNPESPLYDENYRSFRRTTYDNPLLTQEIIDETVKESPAHSIRQEIYAEFLDSVDHNPVIEYDAASAAVKRLPADDDSFWPVWGLDPGYQSKDPSALCKRQGYRMLEPTKLWHRKDTYESAALLQKEYDGTPPELKPREIIIDSNGYGAGTYDQAKRMGLPVRNINVSWSASNKERYFRLRDEGWFLAKEWLETGSLAGDVALMNELVLPVWHVMENQAGKIKVESKEDMKKRGFTSPNRADALILTLFGSQQRRRRVETGMWARAEMQERNKPRSWLAA